MTIYAPIGDLQVAVSLRDAVRDEIAPGSGMDPDLVWQALSAMVRALGPRNRELLDKRDRLQADVDAWLGAHPGQPDPRACREFLHEIGYLLPEGPDLLVNVAHVDAEIARLAGPQLVVPVDNARYALNAANARWGSLYDALYGTDVIPEEGTATKGSRYNPARGDLVIARANTILDEILPLASGSWNAVTALVTSAGFLSLHTRDGGQTSLQDPDLFVGSTEQAGVLTSVLCRHHGLHVDVQIDPADPIGRQHPAGIRDILLEAAISVIMDCEDSVAAVDADDKARVYCNWAGLMRGGLSVRIDKGGEPLVRRLHPDRHYLDRSGQPLTLPGRGLMLVRHVGAHVYTDAVLDSAGQQIPETFLDAVLTTVGAMHDLRGQGPLRNSREGSVYVVKPKQHGPDEVALSVGLFAGIEDFFGLPTCTLKIGIMDEERRTTLNLKECLRAAQDRVIFINTGFLDRTGDEIHTSMEAGPMIPKSEIKNATWMRAYENWNVDKGLLCGLPGHAQIGKGMWPMPDAMRAMLEAKSAHLEAGASCSWVPSPTAATLHAIHYHQVDVADRQRALARRPQTKLEDLLVLPLLGKRRLTVQEIQRELDNNVQGILGYVARWVGQGVGCSKVPDVHDVGLMEDRATLRISSQHVANWLHHGLIDKQQVIETMRRMAHIVDRQNADDPAYARMAPDFERSMAFQAAVELALQGRDMANGYTEHSLIRWRRQYKAEQGGV